MFGHPKNPCSPIWLLNLAFLLDTIRWASNCDCGGKTARRRKISPLPSVLCIFNGQKERSLRGRLVLRQPILIAWHFGSGYKLFDTMGEEKENCLFTFLPLPSSCLSVPLPCPPTHLLPGWVRKSQMTSMRKSSGIV